MRFHDFIFFLATPSVPFIARLIWRTEKSTKKFFFFQSTAKSQISNLRLHSMRGCTCCRRSERLSHIRSLPMRFLKCDKLLKEFTRSLSSANPMNSSQSNSRRNWDQCHSRLSPQRGLRWCSSLCHRRCQIYNSRNFY